MTQSILQAGKCFRPTNVFSEQRRSIPIRIFSSKLNNNFDEKLTFLLLTLYREQATKVYTRKVMFAILSAIAWNFKAKFCRHGHENRDWFYFMWQISVQMKTIAMKN